MAGVISDLKAQARILHRQVASGDPQAVARVRMPAELAGAGETGCPRAAVREADSAPHAPVTPVAASPGGEFAAQGL